MTEAEISKAYADAIIEAIEEMSGSVGADSMVQVCHSLQASLGKLAGSEPTSLPLIRLVTELGHFARLAHAAAGEQRRKIFEDAKRQYGIVDRDPPPEAAD